MKQQYRRLTPWQRKLQRLEYWMHIHHRWVVTALTIIFCLTAQVWFQGMKP